MVSPPRVTSLFGGLATKMALQLCRIHWFLWNIFQPITHEMLKPTISYACFQSDRSWLEACWIWCMAWINEWGTTLLNEPGGLQ